MKRINRLPSFSVRGFTLLELVVVFSIISILSTIGIASYVNFSRSQTLQQSYYDLFNKITFARASAISQVKPSSQCLSTSTLNGYSITINIAAKTYTLNVICSSLTYPLSTTTLPNGVVFNSATDNPPTTTTNIIFSVLTSGVTNPGNVVMSYSGSATIAPKTITISQGGVVQ